MKQKVKKIIGLAFMLTGTGMILAHNFIFDWLIWLFGAEFFVGRQSVLYLPNGGYMYTNPSAMMKWSMGIIFSGLLLLAIGLFLLIRKKKKQDKLTAI